MVPQPEQQARIAIDKLLAQAGWTVCDANAANVHASRGVRVIKPDDLQSVTSDAKAKDHFVSVAESCTSLVASIDVECIQ